MEKFIKTIIFRADGNSKIGYGHLMRLLAIASYCEKDYEIIFLVGRNTETKLLPKRYAVSKVLCTLNEEPSWISKNYSNDKHIIIYDGYLFDREYQKGLKQFDFPVVFIDDLATYKMSADIVINHALNFNAEKYDVGSKTKLAIGTKFALLRSSFLKIAEKERKIKKIKKVFISFGGSDTFQLSSRIANLVKNIPEIVEINVVVGSDSNIKSSSKIIIHSNINENQMLSLMEKSDLAVVPTSTILYELCCVKMPIIAGFFANNQKDIYNAFKDKEIIIPCGNFTEKSDEELIKIIKETIDKKDYKSYLVKQKELFDGKSHRRVLGLINSLSVSFRKATIDDLILVYNWSNNDLVRSNSFDSSKIELESHQIWFKSKIKSNKTLFLIAQINNKPAGIVRYEDNNENTTVGVLVGFEYRGQGLASVFLNKTADLSFNTFNTPIYAYIKPENTASIIAFKNAGYSYFKKQKVSQYESVVYKLDENDIR